MASRYRNRLEVYCDILEAIENERTHNNVKPTHIQKKSKTSYDKFIIHIRELKKNKLINQNLPLSNSTKGIRFINECKTLKKIVKKMHKKYLD